MRLPATCDNATLRLRPIGVACDGCVTASAVFGVFTFQTSAATVVTSVVTRRCLVQDSSSHFVLQPSLFASLSRYEYSKSPTLLFTAQRLVKV
ncbi:unnamed protein product [Macrosiphum euphorbiae]|uniref:Uncharacterized protein n=1 Tax=Macrosiphum euphorbiae TaxID=13131 RepID=A0AAV0Y9S8_9HEMI|nr:unnamed protein product [Macrosiphum euphorbiae]